MTGNRTRNERMLKRLFIFVGVVIVTCLVFLLLMALINPVGDEGMLLVMSFVISLQLCFITAYVISGSKK